MSASTIVDATADRLKRLGGAVYVPPTDSNIGRIAVVADPQTATSGVAQGAETRRSAARRAGQTRARGLARVARRRLAEGVCFLRRAFRLAERPTPKPVRRTPISCSPPAGRRSAACSPSVRSSRSHSGFFTSMSTTSTRPRSASKSGGGQIMRGPARNARRQLDRPMHGPPGRRVRAAGKAKPGSYRARAGSRLVHRVGRFFVEGQVGHQASAGNSHEFRMLGRRDQPAWAGCR